MAIKAKPNKLAFKDSEKARTNITKDQIKEISKLYEQWADDIAKLADKYKNKTTSSSVVQERQLRELEKQIRSAGQNASNEVYKNVKKNIHIVSSNVVKTNKKWLQSLGFKGIEKSLAFSYVPEEVVKKLITGQIYETGWSLSKAIWGDNEDTMKSIYRIVAGGRAENKSSYEIAKDLEEFVRPSAKKKWNLKDKDGRYIYPKQVDYNAQRLARTLTQHAYQQSFIETTKDNPLITSYKWISNGSRVCEICKERDGRIYEKDKLPMDHPNGMCIMQPVVNKDAKKEIADWIKGKENKGLDKFAKKMGYKPKTNISTKVKYNMNKIERDLELYIGGGYSSFKNAVSEQTFKFVKQNMKYTTKPLYRVEEARFTYDKRDFDIGYTFSFDDDIRSFTRNIDYAGKIINEGLEEGFYEHPVVFETVGRVQHFNTDKYAEGYFENQYESLVGGEFEVIDITEKMIDGVIADVVKIRAVNKR